jgi:hypothetical protein
MKNKVELLEREKEHIEKKIKRLKKCKCQNCEDTGYIPCNCFLLSGPHACPDCWRGKEKAKSLKPHG